MSREEAAESALLSLTEHPSHRSNYLSFARNEAIFQRRASGNWSKGCSDAENGIVEIVENFLLHQGRDFSADAAVFDRFMHDNEPAGFLH